MEFNTVQHYRATEPFPLLDEQSGDAKPLMYSGSTLPPQTQTAQPTLSLPPQTSHGWVMGNATQGSHASQRHTMMFLDSRPPRSDVPVSRPLSMTAVPGFRTVGLQNPQGEYLPQPHMPPPVVQPVKLTQAPVVQTDGWIQPKSCGDFEFSNLEPEMADYNHGMLSVDDDTTVIDLRKYSNLGLDHAHDVFIDSSRRMSESTNSMSSHGPFSDVPHFDDSPPSDHPHHQDTDWPPGLDTTGNSLDLSASPRPPSLIRSASRSRASPNPRASPYTLESTRNKRWSTGMYPGQPPPRPPQFNRYSSFYGSPLNPQNAFSSFVQEPMPSLQSQHYLFPSAQFSGGQGSMFYPTSDPFPEPPRPLPSQGMFRLLHSNTDRLSGCYSHCADLSDPPDLYSSLGEKPSDPPEEDMNPSDPDMMPHEQELRFPGDLYTPKWVRGHGNKREGWCGLCKPGRWLVLKNSAFWYDKSFTHGVSAATGAAFQGPQENRRTEGNLDIWEGLCGSCGDWIALVSSKKKGTTWFRHAYKCHTHPKVKDGPKRRREIAVTVTRPSDTTSAGEPTITISSGTPGTEPPSKEPRVAELEDDIHINHESQLSDIKTEDDATPVSTPQLTHTSMSTPQLAMMHTPSSQYQSTPNERKRFSMVLDHSMFSQGFSSHLEAFAEHESEHMSSHDEVLPSTEVQQTSSAVSEPMYTLNHDGTFTQNTTVTSTPISQHRFSSDGDHFMSHDDNSNDFFSQHDQNFDFSTPTPHQTIDFKTTHPPEGNWI